MIKQGKKIKTTKNTEGKISKKIDANPLNNYLDECLGTYYDYKEKCGLFSEDIIRMIVTCTTADEVSHAFDCIRKLFQGSKEDQQLEKFLECIMSK
jgi:hypothetical protein